MVCLIQVLMISYICLLQDVLPKPNLVPCTTYDAKKIICPLGLQVQKIHAYRNHCILYRNKYANFLACPICKSPRFKNSDRLKEGEELKKGIPSLVMWYLPIIPCLKCFSQTLGMWFILLSVVNTIFSGGSWCKPQTIFSGGSCWIS